MAAIYTKEEIAIMAQGGKILSGIMRRLKEEIKPGVVTMELEYLARQMMKEADVKPAFLGYLGFPAVLCVSINEEAVHGIPSKRIIKEGDIVSLDCGLVYKGFNSDMAFTVAVGKVDPEVSRLIRVTKKSLKRAIARMKPGKTLGDLGHAVQTYAESQKFNVVRDLCGHGVGRKLQENPEVLNFGQRHKGMQLEAGMVLALEPILVIGQPGVTRANDGFAYITKDGSLSAHFEHSVAITDKGPRILTE